MPAETSNNPWIAVSLLCRQKTRIHGFGAIPTGCFAVGVGVEDDPAAGVRDLAGFETRHQTPLGVFEVTAI